MTRRRRLNVAAGFIVVIAKGCSLASWKHECRNIRVDLALLNKDGRERRIGVDTVAPRLLLFDVGRNVYYDQSDKLICDPWNYRLPARNLAGVIKRENNGERRKYWNTVFRNFTSIETAFFIPTFDFSTG